MNAALTRSVEVWSSQSGCHETTLNGGCENVNNDKFVGNFFKSLFDSQGRPNLHWSHLSCCQVRSQSSTVDISEGVREMSETISPKSKD